MRGEEETRLTADPDPEIGFIDDDLIGDDAAADEPDAPEQDAEAVSERHAIFAEELAGLARRYKWQFRECPGSRDLCVIFSSTAKRHAFMGQDWPTNVLFILDRDDAYFVIGAGRGADVVGAAINRLGFERVLFFGSSKGGFGAVLWATLCARRTPERLVRSLAFSPQTRLYPFNEELDFRSYKLLWRRAEADPRVMSALKLYGDLRICQREANTIVTLVYGERNLVDRREVGRLFAPQIRKYPVPLKFHGSVIPFTVRHLDPDSLSRWLRNLYTRAVEDPDLNGILPKDPDDLLQEFSAMRWVPSLQEFIRECITIGSPA